MCVQWCLLALRKTSIVCVVNSISVIKDVICPSYITLRVFICIIAKKLRHKRMFQEMFSSRGKYLVSLVEQNNQNNHKKEDNILDSNDGLVGKTT